MPTPARTENGTELSLSPSPTKNSMISLPVANGGTSAMLTNSHCWNDERVELLKKLWADGKSCAIIARQLGGVTRSAVIGKITRLGLQQRSTTQRQKFSRRRANIEKATIIQRPKAGFASIQYISKSATKTICVDPLPLPVATDAGRVRFSDLQAGACKWICNDPRDGAMACGEAQVPGLPYCPSHCARAYQAPEIKPRAAKRKELVYVQA